MTRQEQITRQQVVCKMNDAGNRSTRELDKALAASNQKDYERHLSAATKAAGDFAIWKKVSDAIGT